LHSEDPADGGSALDDMQPQIGPPIPQKPPAPTPFDFAAFMRRSGKNTTTLLATLREADAYLPSGSIVVYSEGAGGAARLNILHIAHILHIFHIAHILHITNKSVIDERF
jgi:hypothetical protein